MTSSTERFMRGALGTYFPCILYALAIITTIVLVRQGNAFWDSYLRSVLLFIGGVQGFWAGISHLFFAEHAAKEIGWQSNGFQTEMGATNIALGVTGFLSWFYYSWQTPVALTLIIIFAGCAYIHLKELSEGNRAPCNSGPMMYVTIITVLTLALALLLR